MAMVAVAAKQEIMNQAMNLRNGGKIKFQI